MGKMTKQDRHVLDKLSGLQAPVSSGLLANLCQFRTSSPGETAARHAIKLTKLGFVQKTGRTMFPQWSITPAGREALSSEQEGRE